MLPVIQCSPPKCEAGCSIDYSTDPCPSCVCDRVPPLIQCSPPKCEAGCWIDYSTDPCPSCACDRGKKYLFTYETFNSNRQ
ncbi:small proline-rich protein 2H-like [Stegodyphus dumicola]|uniref:small proline-rich protein 2H-like n=1 Tax=Stegodyphus dumicola TaxID=202533 RepID=UPI0015B09F25|nr:small proline-rich protein 2H-like [Stegodyphus dumicola]